MFRSIVCSIFVLTAVIAGVVPKLPNDIAVQVLVIDDISKLKDLKQSAQLIPINGVQETTQIFSNNDGVQEKTGIRYNFGYRTSNDSLVAISSDFYQWATSQDVQLTIQYGGGALITHVSILVDQSSNYGRAFILYGGIGQSFISVVVEAYDTRWFGYDARFYGI